MTEERRLVSEVGLGIATAVRRVSNREAFKFVHIDWTALGAALIAEWPFAALPQPATEPEEGEADNCPSCGLASCIGRFQDADCDHHELAAQPSAEDHALNPDHLDNPLREAAQPSAEVERLRAADGRWAFLNPETGDWIEVKSGVVYLAGSDRP